LLAKILNHQTVNHFVSLLTNTYQKIKRQPNFQGGVHGYPKFLGKKRINFKMVAFNASVNTSVIASHSAGNNAIYNASAYASPQSSMAP
jgi:hypothetical protein